MKCYNNGCIFFWMNSRFELFAIYASYLCRSKFTLVTFVNVCTVDIYIEDDSLSLPISELLIKYKLFL